MQQYVIFTGTITHAIKGRDLLRNLGYKVKMERKVLPAANMGCGYTLIVSGDIEKIRSELYDARVKVLEIRQV